MAAKSLPISVCVFLLVLLILSVCSKEETEWSSTAEFDAGVKVILNPENPRDGRINFQIEEDLSIGDQKGDANYILNNPEDIEVTDKGDIYVLDWGDYCIKVFNYHGELLRSIGREGQGPGEFQIPFYFSIDPKGNIYLMDGGNSRVIIMDDEGNQVSGFRLQGGRFSGIETDNKNYLYFAREFREETRMMSIHRFRTNGEEILNFCKFIIVHPRVIEKTGPYSTTTKILPTKVWNITHDGKLYVGSDDKYQISVYDSEGKLTFKFGREYRSNPYDNSFDSSESFRYMSVYARRRLFDEGGNFWIELFNENEEKDFVYDVFSPDGIYLKQVYLKCRIYQFNNGSIFSIVDTDEGFKLVKRFHVVK
jgi:hypothetical protein